MTDEPVTRETFGRLWNFGDAPATEGRFRELLDTIDEADTNYRLEVRTQIARTRGLQREFDDAHAMLDEIEKELEGAEPVVKVRYLLERGRAFNSSKKKDQAIPRFEEAWNLAKEIQHDNYAIDAAHMLAIAEPGEAGHQWNVRALELARTTENEHASGWQGALLNNIGWYHHEQGDYQAAYDNLKKAWEFRTRLEEKKGLAEPTDALLAFRWSAIRQLRDLDRVDECLEGMRELEKVYEAREKPSGFVFEEIGECLLLQGQEKEARPYFKKAHEILKESWVVHDDPERIERLGKLGG